MKHALSQQEFLRQAMADLGKLWSLDRAVTRDEMCVRLGCTRPTFDKWMLDSANGREMPNTMWCHVREIVALEKLRRKTSPHG